MALKCPCPSLRYSPWTSGNSRTFPSGSASNRSFHPGNTVDEQIQVTVPVHVREGCPGGELIRARRLTDLHFFEMPIAQIAIEPVGPLQTAKVDVRPAVSVHITDRHAGAVVRHGIRQISIASKRVGERYSSSTWSHQCETRFPAGSGMHLDGPKSCALGPR